jgi:hypothetical protein
MTMEAAKQAAEKAHGSKIEWKSDEDNFWSWADFYITKECLTE